MKSSDDACTAAHLSWPPLVSGTLIRRYKRFLADVRLADGREVVAHCPNSGSMAACSESGRPVYLSCHDNPRRKLKYTWELIEMPTSLVGINTLVPNRLVARAAAAGCLPVFAGYRQVTPEVKVSAHSRLDLLLRGDGLADCFVEIKNCTLVERGIARFPDARTVRGQKHLAELVRLKQRGVRAVMVFIVQRSDAHTFEPADDIDPLYGRALRQAVAAGVEMVVYDVALDLAGIALHRTLPCRL